MRRSRIITEVRDIRQEKGPNMPESVERGRTGEPGGTTLEELVGISAEELKRLDVVNASGEKLGKIEDLMIDIQKGQIIYAVLSFGGISSLSRKLFAIPWETMCIEGRWNYQDIYRQRIVFNIPREKLEQAPGFDKDEWPAEPDKAWINEVFAYFGCQPYWASPEEASRPQPPPG